MGGCMGFGKDNRGAIIRETQTITVGALAADAAVTGTALAITDDFRILKTVIDAHIDGLTAAEGIGLRLGIANGDLTVAQIAEAITTDGPLNSSDRDKIEEAERFAKQFAIAEFSNAAETEMQFKNEQGGALIEVKPRWTFNKGVGWDWFVFNNGPTLTTGASLRIVATHYGVWVD